MILEYTYLDENNNLKIINTKISNLKFHKDIYLNSLIIESNLNKNVIRSFWNENHCLQKYKLHNLNKPALIVKDKNIILREEWFKDGFNHRLDGPAIIDQGDIVYYIGGQDLSDDSEDFANVTKHLICKSCEKFCKQSCF